MEPINMSICLWQYLGAAVWEDPSAALTLSVPDHLWKPLDHLACLMASMFLLLLFIQVLCERGSRGRTFAWSPA